MTMPAGSLVLTLNPTEVLQPSLKFFDEWFRGLAGGSA